MLDYLPLLDIENLNMLRLVYSLQFENKLRQLQAENPTEQINHNNRPIQLLNNRTVYEYNIPSPCSMPASTIASTGTSNAITTTTSTITYQKRGLNAPWSQGVDHHVAYISCRHSHDLEHIG